MEPLANSKNVATLLLRRELNGGKQSLCLRGYGGSDLQRHLESWQEGDFLRHCSAEYAIFNPAPRSTIALSYNCDGSLLASTQ